MEVSLSRGACTGRDEIANANGAGTSYEHRLGAPQARTTRIPAQSFSERRQHGQGNSCRDHKAEVSPPGKRSPRPRIGWLRRAIRVHVAMMSSPGWHEKSPLSLLVGSARCQVPGTMREGEHDAELTARHRGDQLRLVGLSRVALLGVAAHRQFRCARETRLPSETRPQGSIRSRGSRWAWK